MLNYIKHRTLPITSEHSLLEVTYYGDKDYISRYVEILGPRNTGTVYSGFIPKFLFDDLDDPSVNIIDYSWHFNSYLCEFV